MNLRRIMYGPKPGKDGSDKDAEKTDYTDVKTAKKASLPPRRGILSMPELTQAVYRLTEDVRRLKAENDLLGREIARLKRAQRHASTPPGPSSQ